MMQKNYFMQYPTSRLIHLLCLMEALYLMVFGAILVLLENNQEVLLLCTHLDCWWVFPYEYTYEMCTRTFSHQNHEWYLQQRYWRQIHTIYGSAQGGWATRRLILPFQHRLRLGPARIILNFNTTKTNTNTSTSTITNSNSQNNIHPKGINYRPNAKTRIYSNVLSRATSEALAREGVIQSFGSSFL